MLFGLFGRIKLAIASSGLTAEQKLILKRLASKKVGFLRELGRAISKDEDFSQADMMSSALGTEVLRRQVEKEREEKREIESLKEQALQQGISKWRINLVS